jgi:hypothetical protein
MKSKCCICKGKGVKYTENIRIYNGKKWDIGYWVVCQCQLLNNKKQYEKYVDNTLNVSIFTIYTNNNFLDSKTPFNGNFQAEYKLMKDLFLSVDKLLKQ